jgi:D-3-phosphoglycerate dehydrogenase
MKDGIIIINTARAGLVNHHDILLGLEQNKIWWFATDVYDQEPPGMTALISHARTITTPHIGGYTEESIDRALNEAIDYIIEAVGEK